MNGAIPLLPLYDFMACTGTNLLFTSTCINPGVTLEVLMKCKSG
jgi:hypothetical protein